MSEPFLAEIKIVGFNFAPRGWALCDGQILPINQNQSLYSLLGTTYGGDGRTTFGLPEMRGRTPIHEGQDGVGSSHSLGQRSGEETHSLSIAETPQHKHSANVSNANGDAPIAIDNTLGEYNNMGNNGGNLINLSNAINNAGGGQGHQNMQPYLALNYCIALQGLFPSRN